jgi:VWFA-related protein
MHRHLFARSTASVLALLLTTASLTSFAFQARTAEPLTLDILALSSDGRPVRDLKPEDLTIRLDGKTRTLRSLQLIPVGDAPGSGVRTPGPAVPPPSATNVTTRTGRAIAIVIDDESLRAGEERRAKMAVTQLLDELPVTDRVALMTVPHGGVKVDFTTDRAKFKAALAPIVGQAPSTPQAGQAAACQTRTVLEHLLGVLATVDPAAGPTTFVLLTGGLAGPRSDTVRAVAGGASSVRSTVGMCELTPDLFQQVGNAVAQVRAQFYVVQAEHNLSGGSGETNAFFGGNDNPLVGMEHLAGVTGGQVLHLASNTENALGRIARETSAHYLVSFDVDASERNNAGHRLEIKSVRSDVVVRARPTVVIAKADAKGVKVAAKDTLRDAKPYRDVAIRAQAFASRNTGDDKLKLAVVVDPIDPSVTFSAVAIGLYDAAGKLVAQWTARPENLTEKPMMAALLIAPGTYRMRVAANDAGGATGVVDSSITPALTTAGPLKLSNVVLGIAGAGGFVPRLEFAAEPAAIVFFEMYGGRANMQLGAQIQVSETVEGPTVATAPVQWSASAEPDKFNGRGEIPLAALKSGDYVVRVVVAADGQPEGRVIQTLRKR